MTDQEFLNDPKFLLHLAKQTTEINYDEVFAQSTGVIPAPLGRLEVDVHFPWLFYAILIALVWAVFRLRDPQ